MRARLSPFLVASNLLLAACLIGCGRVNYSATDAPGDAGIDASLSDADIDTSLSDIDAFAPDVDIDAFAPDVDAFAPDIDAFAPDAFAPDAAPLRGPLAFDHFIKASNTGPSDEYGTSIALSGDGNTLAVGAIYEDSTGLGINPPSNEAGMSNGAVYVYVRTGSTWAFQALIKASDTDNFDEFGRSIALSEDGNTLAVGAPREDGSGMGPHAAIDEASSNSGAVFVYTRSAAVWSFEGYIKANNTGASDNFGASVALDARGDFLAVGAPGEDSSGTLIDPASSESAPDSGAVYTYTRSATTWAFGNRIKASDASANALFGTTVALSATRNTLAVGAPAAPLGGAVYVYQRTIAWSFQDALRGNNTGASDLFGAALAITNDGRTIAVGANGEATRATGIDPTPNRLAQDTGAAYVFDFDGARWTQSAFIKASNASVDNFAWSLALDATGDYLVVGSIFEDGNGMGIDATPGEGLRGSGAAYSFIRRGTTWEEVHYIKAFNTGMSDHFGAAVAMSRDGRTLAIGAPLESSSGTGVDSTPNDSATGAGAVYLYR